MAPVTTMLSHALHLAVDDQSTLLWVNWHSPARDTPLVIEQRLVADESQYQIWFLRR